MNAACFHLLHVRPSQGLAAELKANAIIRLNAERYEIRLS
jgi:hypothetical protein